MKTRIKAMSLAVIIAILVTAATFSVNAFYTEYLRQKFNMSVSIELMFDMLSKDGDENSALSSYQSSLSGFTSYNPDAKWGTEQNPYIISDFKYLQNLSALQNYGYFNDIFFSDVNDVPYFLVCTNDYKAVTIDGSGATIAPIGNDDYPFKGVMKGIKADSNQNLMVGKQSADTSALYNINISSDEHNHDIGLFGAIGHTGVLPTDSAESFSGKPSIISDLLLADISVSSSHSILDQLSDWFGNHTFIFGDDSTYTDSNGNTQNVVRDTHHIGILTGHVQYAEIKNISIFYSSNDICALNIAGNATGSLSNYYSSTGIIGLMDNMNPKYENNTITVNSGTTDSELSHSLVAGGGKLSGNKAGFVNATDIFENYKYDSTGAQQPTDEHKILGSYNGDNESLTQEVTMNNSFSSVRNVYDYFYDGVFTFALSNSPGEDTVKNIWNVENGELTAPDITYSPDNDNEWKYGQIDSSSYVATLIPQSSLSNISSNDNYVICYEGNDGKLHLMNNSSPSLTLAADYKTSNQNYVINCQTNKEYINDYLMKLSSSGTTYTFGSAGDSTKKLGISSSSYGDSAEFSLYFGDNSQTGTGRLTAGWLSAAPVRYTNTWGITAENGGYVLSLNASYNQSRSTGFLNYNYTGASSLKYLSFDGENFIVSSTKPDSGLKKIIICKVTVDWTNFNEDDPSAPHGYIPANPDNSGVLSDASSHVFYANDEYHYDSNGSATPSITDNNYTTSNSVNNNFGLSSGTASNTQLTYNLQSIESLGWKASDGSTTLTSLNKKFSLKQGIDIGVSASFFGFKYYSKGIISAPIGTDGTSTDMPTGTIAFKINKVPEGGAKINVIVAANTDQSVENSSFGLWKATAQTGFFLTTTSFNKERPMTSFAIPNTKTLADGDINQYYKVYVDGELNRTYLNGNVILVAHTFTVYEEGVYIMGSTNGPMNICYFSADGVASGGINQIGDIDYVYSNSSEKIISVGNTDTREGAVTEDFDKYYYPSLALVYTSQAENPSAYINCQKVYIRRYIENSTRNLDVLINSDTVNKYFDVSFYSWYSDKDHVIQTP